MITNNKECKIMTAPTYIGQFIDKDGEIYSKFARRVSDRGIQEDRVYNFIDEQTQSYIRSSQISEKHIHYGELSRRLNTT